MMVDHGVEMWIITEDDREIFPFLVPAEDDGLAKYYPFFLVFCLNGGDRLNSMSSGKKRDRKGDRLLF
jgi:hypothetical protein